MSIPVCRDCFGDLHRSYEKAIGESVWADDAGEWVCPTTGNEHRPVPA